MSLITDLSASELRKAAALKEKIDELEAELTRLLTTPLVGRSASFSQSASGTDRQRRKMSPAARAKIAAAARARWKKAKAAGKNTL